LIATLHYSIYTFGTLLADMSSYLLFKFDIRASRLVSTMMKKKGGYVMHPTLARPLCMMHSLCARWVSRSQKWGGWTTQMRGLSLFTGRFCDRVHAQPISLSVSFTSAMFMRDFLIRPNMRPCARSFHFCPTYLWVICSIALRVMKLASEVESVVGGV
jgi:hypothetical protein